MAMVVINLDTETRQLIMTVDGEQVMNPSLMLEKWMSEDDDRIFFEYRTKDVMPNGLVQDHVFSLPHMEDMPEPAMSPASLERRVKGWFNS